MTNKLNLTPDTFAAIAAMLMIAFPDDHSEFDPSEFTTPADCYDTDLTDLFHNANDDQFIPFFDIADDFDLFAFYRDHSTEICDTIAEIRYAHNEMIRLTEHFPLASTSPINADPEIMNSPDFDLYND